MKFEKYTADGTGWTTIDENRLLADLTARYGFASPMLIELLQRKMIRTGEAVYRVAG